MDKLCPSGNMPMTSTNSKTARTMPENESNLLNDDIHLFGAGFEGVRRVRKVSSPDF